MSKKKKFVPAANALLFSGRELLAIILPVLALVLLALPAAVISSSEIRQSGACMPAIPARFPPS